MAIESVSRAGTSANVNSTNIEVRPMIEATKAKDETLNKPAAETSSEGKTKGNTEENQELVEKSNEKIKKAVSEINKQMSHTQCQFGIHERTGRVTIKLVDKETKEVLKEYPPEETLELIAKAWDLAGIKVDRKL